MERADRICRHPLWRARLAAIAERERDRPFCRHGIAHLTDVARLAWIENLERGLGVPKALIYAAALVHDLGRAGPDGVPHERAGLTPAREILDGCGFTAATTLTETVSGARTKTLTATSRFSSSTAWTCSTNPAEGSPPAWAMTTSTVPSPRFLGRTLTAATPSTSIAARA